MNKKTLSLIVFILLSLIWSSTWLFIKLGLESMPPFYSAGWRFLIAALILFLYSRHLKIPFPRDARSHRFLFLFGLSIFTISYGLVYWGEQYLSSGLTSVLFSVMPFYTAGLTQVILPEEKLTPRKALGILLGFIGLLFIFNDQIVWNNGPLATAALIAILVSPAFSALGTIQGKKAAGDYHPVMLNTLPLLYAAGSFFLLHLILEPPVTPGLPLMGYVSLAYLAVVGTALAFVLYFWMLGHTSALLMSSITFITPPLALFWGWLILGEPITVKLILGMVVIFGGIYLVRD